MQHFIKDNIEELDDTFSKKRRFTVIHNSKSRNKDDGFKSKLETSSSSNSSTNTTPKHGDKKEKKVDHRMKNELNSDKFDRE